MLPRADRGRLLLAAVLLSAGCASAPGGGTAEPSAASRAAAERAVAELFPTRCRMSHKLRLAAGGREALLTGRLVLDREHGLRAVALDEIGGPVFAMTVCGDDRSVELAPPGVDPELVMRGPLRDLELLFLEPADPPTGARAVNDTVVLEWPTARGRIERWAEAASGRLERCREWAGNRLLRDIELSYGNSRGNASTSPWRIVVRNRALHYRLEMELLALELVPEPAASGRAALPFCG